MDHKKKDVIGTPLNLFNPHHVMRYMILIEVSKCVFSLIADLYSDVDYSSYRDQAQLYLDGELNYANLIGNGGP